MALAHDMGKKALAEHIKRMKVYGTVADTGIRELHKVRYETWGNPFISIVVCSVGNLEYMKKLITSLFEKARYSNFEVIIVDRDASDETLLSYYRRMENIRKNIKVFINENLATMHSMRNYGASMAKGDYILFLDSNLEVMDFTAIGDMLGMCIREDVGIVSGVLYNDNQTTFQKGMLVGVNGVATYMHRGVKKGDRSYMMLNRANTNHSAVSASCMLVKTSLYNKVGGFSDKYKTDITDIDFCLRIRELNYYITCVADAGWYYHRISYKSNPKDVQQDTNLFAVLWSNVLIGGDPFYNPNFVKDGDIFAV